MFGHAAVTENARGHRNRWVHVIFELMIAAAGCADNPAKIETTEPPPSVNLPAAGPTTADLKAEEKGAQPSIASVTGFRFPFPLPVFWFGFRFPVPRNRYRSGIGLGFAFGTRP